VALALAVRALAPLLASVVAVPAGLYGVATAAGFALRTAGDGEPRTRRIHVLATPVHTDLVLPIVDDVADWRALVLTDAFPRDGEHRRRLAESGSHVGFGWGSRTFFLNVRRLEDIRPRFLVAAASDTAVMHVTVFGDLAASSDVRAVDLSEAGYRRLVAALADAFDPAAPLPGRSYHDADGFFSAAGTYSPFVTCNVWAGWMLADAGVDVGWWTPFAATLLASLPRRPD
jgi:uncharacterized protein (TIGR02117 family)